MSSEGHCITPQQLYQTYILADDQGACGVLDVPVDATQSEIIAAAEKEVDSWKHGVEVEHTIFWDYTIYCIPDDKLGDKIDGRQTCEILQDTDEDIEQYEYHSGMVECHPDPDPCITCRDDHEFISTHEVEGGLKENPGVFGNGGGVIINEHCKFCSVTRRKDTWATNPDDGTQGHTSITYGVGHHTTEYDRLDNLRDEIGPKIREMYERVADGDTGHLAVETDGEEIWVSQFASSSSWTEGCTTLASVDADTYSFADLIQGSTIDRQHVISDEIGDEGRAATEAEKKEYGYDGCDDVRVVTNHELLDVLESSDEFRSEVNEAEEVLEREYMEGIAQ